MISSEAVPPLPVQEVCETRDAQDEDRPPAEICVPGCRPTFSGKPGFKDKQYRPHEITQALRLAVSGMLLREAALELDKDNVTFTSPCR